MNSTAVVPAARARDRTGAVPPLVRVRPAAFPHRGEWRQLWDLSRTLARHELKQRYFGSVVGHLWALLRPLMLFGVMYFVFTHIVKFGTAVPNYPIYLLTSLVVWGYFAETTATGVTCLVAHENLLRKIRFPRLMIPLSLALTSAYQLVLNVGVVVAFMLLSGIGPRWTWLAAIPLIACFCLFTVGVTMGLASVYVRFRDTNPIWEVFSQLLFWASPIIYVATFPPPSVRELLAASPVSATLTQLRVWLIDPAAPTAADVLGGKIYLLIPVAIAISCMVLGVLVFGYMAPRVAEEL